MEIVDEKSLAYFVMGLNALIDAGETYSKEEVASLVDNQKIIRELNDKYHGEYWDFGVLSGFENNLCRRLKDTGTSIPDDTLRKYCVQHNGLVALSSLCIDLLLSMTEKKK